MPYGKLKALAEQGSVSELETAWMAAIESPEADFAGLVPALETLRDKGEAETAEILAWSALNQARDRLGAEQALPIASAMLMALDESEELRSETAALFRQVHADAPQIDELIDRSGLADGSKTARRALRTLEVCLAAEPGGYLLSRRDEAVARVVSADPAADRYVVLLGAAEQGLTGDELAAEFAPADADDFRVLERFRHDRLAELLEGDAASLVVSIIKSRGGRIRQEQLRYLLTPRHLPAEAWAKWWSKARAGLKRDRCVRIEGRAPVTLIYDKGGTDLEADAWRKLTAARTPSKMLHACDSYFRECRAVRHEPDADFLDRAIAQITERIERLRRHDPADAWAAALIADWLAERRGGEAADTPARAVEFLRTVDQPAELLLELTESKLWPRAVTAVRDALGGGAADAFAAVLPRAPEGMCDDLADVLIAAGQADRLTDLTAEVCARPVECAGALAWLWKGPKEAEHFAVPPPIEMLLRMVGGLAEISRDHNMPTPAKNKVRQAVKGALTAGKYAPFDECLSQIDESMAATLRNQIDRADGLGTTAPSDLLELIRKRFPALWAKPKVAPWEDESVIYTTAAGLQKREREIDHLVNVEMVENAKAIGEAAAHGDLSENAEYRFALERRDMLRSRLAVMQEQMLKARILDPDDPVADHVTVGSRVRLARVTDGSAVKMTLLGPWDADPAEGVYNYKAPLCRNVLGRRLGETVHLDLDGEEHAYRIEHIESGV